MRGIDSSVTTMSGAPSLSTICCACTPSRAPTASYPASRSTRSTNVRTDWWSSMTRAFMLSVLLLYAQSAGIRGQAAGPAIAGTWKLNVEKSNLQMPADYLEIRQYSMRPDGYLVGLLINGTPRAYHYLQFVAKSDGKDYPE